MSTFITLGVSYSLSLCTWHADKNSWSVCDAQGGDGMWRWPLWWGRRLLRESSVGVGSFAFFLVRKRPQTGWFSDVIKYVIAEYGSCSTAFNSGIHLAKWRSLQILSGCLLMIGNLLGDHSFRRILQPCQGLPLLASCRWGWGICRWWESCCVLFLMLLLLAVTHSWCLEESFKKTTYIADNLCIRS